MLFSPNTKYSARSPDTGCRFNYTHFDFGLGKHYGVLDHFQMSGIISASMISDEIRLFTNAYRQYKLGTPMSGIRLRGSLTILLAKIMECYALGQHQGRFLSQKQSKSLQTLQPVFDFIKDHLQQPLRIKELAAVAGISEKYFIH